MQVAAEKERLRTVEAQSLLQTGLGSAMSSRARHNECVEASVLERARLTSFTKRQTKSLNPVVGKIEEYLAKKKKVASMGKSLDRGTEKKGVFPDFYEDYDSDDDEYNVESDPYWELKMGLSQSHDANELYGLNLTSGRKLEGTVFVPVLHCTPQEKREEFNVQNLDKCPYYCEGVVLGMKRRIEVTQLSTHPRSPSGRDMSEYFSGLRDGSTSRDLSSFEAWSKKVQRSTRKEAKALGKFTEEKGLHQGSSSRKRSKKRGHLQKVEIATSKKGNSESPVKRGAWSRAAAVDPEDPELVLPLGRDILQRSENNAQIQESSDSEGDDSFDEKLRSLQLLNSSERFGEVLFAGRQAVGSFEVDFHFEEERLTMTIELFPGEKVPDFQTSAQAMAWLEHWADSGVYKMPSYWGPLLINVVPTDIALQHVLRCCEIPKSPFYIPQYCLECGHGRKLIPFNLDLYRMNAIREGKNEGFPFVEQQDRTSLALPKNYHNLIRRECCEHAGHEIVFHCPSYCCFYSCCHDCHERRFKVSFSDYLKSARDVVPPNVNQKVYYMHLNFV